MDVEYNVVTRHTRGVATERESIEFWLANNLKSGGIEKQTVKLANLLAIIGTQWLEQNYTRVHEVAQAIDCPGYDHKIVAGDK